ncbi:MAG: patatin-like phospholipase family protein [Pirellulales bacterium]
MSIPEEPADASELEARTADPRTALCLSGGGFRAALFHLGALRRLNELGVLSKVSTISSVSGGSILAAHLATHVRPWPAAGSPFADWSEKVEAPFHRFVKNDIRTTPVLKRFLLPWNWPRPSTQVKALEACYHKHLTDLKLSDLPEQPTFVFCAADMVFGVSWVFERRRVGSYQAGYFTPPADYPVARAVAASSCFPPVFSPLPIEVPPVQAPKGSGKRSRLIGMSVSDGGLYDNLGLQPVEKHGTVLVSDGGQPFVAAIPHGLFGRAKAYLNVSGKQAGALRKRLLISQFVDGIRKGTYWGIGSAVRRYRSNAAPGYSKDLATGTIAPIRTDMDAFSDAEIAVLMNHGYLLADIALEVHAPQLLGSSAAQAIPHSHWMDEAAVAQALKHSDERNWLGRR